ncbi:MAG TPA: hypothetical protein GX004_03745 [Firmicutes bacterium]|jgi:hypothetical protein|nr:hypothetical protein [Bacillota bacterium]
MHACPRCGKRTDAEYLIWKGGINRALCEDCEREERKAEGARDKKYQERERDR